MTDLTGQVFGRLTVIGRGAAYKVRVKCVCGAKVDVVRYSLTRGRTRSCGCLKKENCGPEPTANPKDIKALMADPSLSLADIGQRVGVSRERVRQIALRFGVRFRDRQLVRSNTKLMDDVKAKEAREAAIFDAWQTTGECDGYYSSRVINRCLAVVGMKRCCQCNLPKDLAEMAKGNNGSRAPRCKACTATNANKFYHRLKAEHPIVWRRRVRLANQRQAERLREAARA